MKPDWTELTRELALWQDEGLRLPLWWRDDDAVADTAALSQLTTLSETLDLPVHLAVIPAHIDDSLPPRVAGTRQLIPLVHGWAHDNHAPAGDKKAEFGAHRSLPDMVQDCRMGLMKLRFRFGPRLLPIFVPPWNRIAPELIPELAPAGFTALSTFTPRARALAAPSLVQINTHLDPIDWRGDRSLADPARLIAQVASDLANRRAGRTDPDEPYGILTHHLVHDTAIWRFTEDLLCRLLDGPAFAWHMPGTSPIKGAPA